MISYVLIAVVSMIWGIAVTLWICMRIAGRFSRDVSHAITRLTDDMIWEREAKNHALEQLGRSLQRCRDLERVNQVVEETKIDD